MAKTLINTQISTTELTFKPGGDPICFEVNAVNTSDRFASFQVEVMAAGADENLNPNWYILSPEICTKKPPGDSTQFIVTIIDNPLPGFVGKMNLTVRIFSIELQEETRQLLRLTILEGTGGVALKLTLPTQTFQVYPQQQIKIPVQLFNRSSQPANAIIKLTGINPDWLIEEQQVLHIASRVRVDTAFLCQIPDVTQALSQTYPFVIIATLINGLSSQVSGNLLVLPQGTIEFRSSPQEYRIPIRRKFFWRSDPVTFQLEFENCSNVPQTCQIAVQCPKAIKYELQNPSPLLFDKNSLIESTLQDLKTENVSSVELPCGETHQIMVLTKAKRHWFGRVRELLIEVAAELSDQRLSETSPPTQLLKLKVLPFIPVWLILGSGVVLLGLLLWLFWLSSNNPFFGHQKPVNSVQLDGLGTTVISGSNDQTIADWEVKGFFNLLPDQFSTIIGNSQKAVRVVRYRPLDNNIVAAGLENGEIQLWGLTGESGLIDVFSNHRDDRVFALEFTQDSQTLLSGHGSGLVLQWDTSIQRGETARGSDRLLQKKQFDFAVYALKFVGKGDKNLAVAGRYNQFLIWNLDSNQTFKIPYLPGGQEDYILTVDVAAIAPYILATGDNQGNITIWNMQPCVEGSEPCEVLDQWLGNKNGEAVRSVSLSDNACYLASAGDDGKVTLWVLNSEGKRATNLRTGQVIKQEVSHSYHHKKMNSVHLRMVGENILIASGSDDDRVRLKKQKRQFNLGCDSQNNIDLF